jgi:hypothetical protein
MSTAKFIIVLPCEGAPYVWKNELFANKGKGHKERFYEEICKIINGDLWEKIDPTMMRIHPMMQNRWRIADLLRQKKGVEIYCNENGMNDCTPNMACLRVVRDLPSGNTITMEQYHSAPLKIDRAPYFGEIAMVVSEKVLSTVVKDIQSLFLVRVADYYAEMGIEEDEDSKPTIEGYEKCLEGYIFEPEDNAEAKKFKTFAVAKEWGLDTFGQVYAKKTGRPDEKQSADYDSDSEDEDEDDYFEDCDCGYTHSTEDKCPNEATKHMYDKWRNESSDEDEPVEEEKPVAPVEVKKDE